MSGRSVYHRAYGPLIRDAFDVADLVLVDVDDGSGTPPLPGSVDFETAVSHAASAPLPVTSPDDLYVVCTGGTTGVPKAVLWRQADIYVSAMGGSADATAESITAAMGRDGGAWYAAPPLMHAAAQWTAFAGLHNGNSVVLHDDSRPFDAREILEVAEQERVGLLTIVGDAYARPLVDELRRRTYDLASLHTLGTGGAATNEVYKEALLELIPHLTIVDGYGSSETGGMAFGARTRDAVPAGFSPSTGAAVVSEARDRFLDPGDDEVGWTARRGRVPLGYLGDRDRTESTFPIVDGERIAIPGDRARLNPDGTIVMLGRDATIVNSGGEKIFAEEVEAVVRRHPAVVDALVVGRPSERFGEEVVAVVALGAGATVDPFDLRSFVAGEIGGSRHRGRWRSATGSSATPAARPTTAGPAGRCDATDADRWTLMARSEVAPVHSALDAPSRGSGLGDVEVAVADRERLAGSVLGPGLHEVELALLELEVGPVRVDEWAQHLLTLVGRELFDQPEGLLGHHDPVGRHAGGLLGPPRGPVGDDGRVHDLGEHTEVFDLAGLDRVTRQQHPAGQHRPESVEEQMERSERRAEEARGGHADLRCRGPRRRCRP